MMNKYRFNMKWAMLVTAFLLPGCEALPRDPENTSQRIAHERQFKVGMVAGTERRKEGQQLIGEISKRIYAHPSIAVGTAEDLLQRVSDGNLDLVLGEFTKASPWKTEVAFGPPLRASGPKSDPLELKAAMRNGENRWIMLVERASRAVSAEARSQ
ncbi:hypothetical protein [Novosphingobium sp. 9]|uniref:hypothetical protein n=1 Tax=Novosphingobium sp. 9 TaxID=2025349 RepID=UPI0021B5D5C0|nr:hypothetical protein [Novosphingobium sp. 9]